MCVCVCVCACVCAPVGSSGQMCRNYAALGFINSDGSHQPENADKRRVMGCFSSTKCIFKGPYVIYALLMPLKHTSMPELEK